MSVPPPELCTPLCYGRIIPLLFAKEKGFCKICPRCAFISAVCLTFFWFFFLFFVQFSFSSVFHSKTILTKKYVFCSFSHGFPVFLSFHKKKPLSAFHRRTRAFCKCSFLTVLVTRTGSRHCPQAFAAAASAVPL